LSHGALKAAPAPGVWPGRTRRAPADGAGRLHRLSRSLRDV